MKASNKTLLVVVAGTIILAVAFAFVTHAHAKINVSSKPVPIANFSAVDLRLASITDITVGDKPSLVIEADADVLPYIDASISGDTLYIDTKSGLNYRSARDINIKIVTPVLNNLSLSGAGSINVKNVQSDDFKLVVRGSGDVKMQGTAKKFEVNLLGSGNINTKALIADDVTIKLQGAGDVTVTAKNLLNADLSGMGNVKYYGNPKSVNQALSGMGNIQAMGE
ncbi:MAG: DUF2807 domain-containing protein [Gammaproteobacteria bacterium]|nr:DUF2807 domain-containing protein [Gammaproteobacteria bacterium]